MRTLPNIQYKTIEVPVSIFLLCVIFTAGVLALYFLVSLYVRFVYKILVTDKLAAIDEIMETGEIPVKWKRRPWSFMMHRGKDTVFFAGVGFLLKKRYIHRLKKLMRYVQHCPGLNGDERESYDLELEEILKDWKSKTVKQLL